MPLVFVDGDPEKVARIQALLPDATYTTWARIRGALARAIASPPEAPVVVRSTSGPRSGVPLAKKLGIRGAGTVALAGAPPRFEDVLGRLPAGTRVTRRGSAERDLTLWFVDSRRELERGIARMAQRAERGGLWIAWPKQSAAHTGDVTQAAVRATALRAGLVDFKICAIDATWSGLRFTRTA